MCREKFLEENKETKYIHHDIDDIPSWKVEEKSEETAVPRFASKTETIIPSPHKNTETDPQPSSPN